MAYPQEAHEAIKEQEVMDLSLHEILQELDHRINFGGWKTRFFNTPTTKQDYVKHWEFFSAGKDHPFRLFSAGNRCGKSLAASVELVQHLNGDYHPLWDGKVFDGPVNVWIVGRTAELIRQTLQPLLLGDVGRWGSGLIPKDDLDLETMTDAKRASTPITSFRVKHKNGGYSTVAFKSGEQGREAFQAAALDIVWLDEEIPFDVYNECQVRLMTRKGISMATFTPLKGSTDLVQTFAVNGNFTEGDVGNGKYVVRCSMYDVPHLERATIEQLEASTPPFLRDARIHGIPALGAGAIYPVPESEFVIPSFSIPNHWPRLFGLDVGGKTAAVWLAKNPDTNQWHAWGEYYKERAEPSIHAAAILARGKWIPGAIDPASRGRSQIDGQQLMEMYSNLGLNVKPAVNAVEAGLYTVWEMLSTDQLKIHDNCTYLLQEIRGYHRDEKGHVVKKNDHLCDALRYSVMTRDIAITELKTKPIVLSGLPTVSVWK